MSTWFSGARKDPVVIRFALPARLENLENFLTHGQSTFGVFGFSTHDQDRSVEEVKIRIVIRKTSSGRIPWPSMTMATLL
jgi:hypothetical protein